jgi:hypothetical protein
MAGEPALVTGDDPISLKVARNLRRSARSTVDGAAVSATAASLSH